ncbi:GvpL/GvpF family gas vesicle protein [Streptomyces sp. NPDC003327]
MALYVYAVTKSSHPLRLDGLDAVGGDSGSAPRPVRGDTVCAVVSEAPEELAMERRDLERHLAVQERLWADGATLPLSFGSLAQDEEAVRALLDQQAEQFVERLEELAGRAEFNVKGLLDEEVMLRQIVEESEDIRDLNAVTRDGGGTYEDRLQLGQRVSEEVQARQEALAESVLAALRPHVRAERMAEPSQQYFVNVSFLVDDEHAEAFNRAVEELAEGRSDGVEIRIRGPLPPYSFA